MTPFARARDSLRFNLMAWLVVPGAIILGVSVWLSYGSAIGQATLVTDRQLIASARMIAEQIQYGDNGLTVVIPPSALELFASDSHDEIAYAVIGPKGELVAGYPGLEAPAAPPADLEYKYFETVFRTEAMRATILRQPVITPDGERSYSVLMGETLKARNELVQSLWLRGFTEQALLVLAAGISIWVGINRGLRPLLRLRQAVLRRPADSFEPFDAAAVQSELRPLVLALNDYMERLQGHLARQQRFLDSAAHQLRTPLAVMKTQIGFARRTPDTSELNAALTQVDGNLSALSRLTNQLLVLGRVENQRTALKTETVELGSTVREVVSEAAPRALDAGLDLSFETNDQCYVAASQMLLREMVVNLVDNAIAHAGSGASASVRVTRSARSVVLTVEDDGAGVEDGERPLLLQRFRRGRAARSGGSGLGLSIVAEIAEAFGGSVDLRPHPGGGGFAAVVTLPLAAPGQAGDGPGDTVTPEVEA